MPDEPLFAAPEARQLATAGEGVGQGQREIKDPRAAPMVGGFSDEWLRLEELADLDKEPMVFPTFKAELRDPLRAESQALIDQVVWKGDGKLSTLLEAPYTFLDGPLAQYYGVAGISGDTLQQVPQDRTKRVGLLGQGSVLAVTGVPDGGLTSLIFRGLYVRERLLCEELPDPPPNAAAMNPPFTPTTTAREWSASRQALATCGACHHRIDPIGFGLENFDGVGLWRDTDHGKPVDATGELSGTDVDGSFTGEAELAHKLAGSQQVQGCLALQLFRYGHGRRESDRDACTIETLKRNFAASGGDVRGLLVAL